MVPTMALKGADQRTCVTRLATSEDNAALLALARACPMQADISVAIERDPDFLSLVNARGGGRVYVAEVGTRVVGCASVCRRGAYVLGRPAEMGYIGDIKVLPVARGHGVARCLLNAIAADEARALPAPYVGSVAVGNRSLDRMMARWRRDDPVVPVGTFTAYQLLPRPLSPGTGRYEIGRAEERDEPELVALLDRYHRDLTFAPVFRDGGFRAILDRSPGMRLDSYRVARRGGRLVAALAAWDAIEVKRTRLCRLTPFLRAVGHLVRLVRSALPLPPFPKEGEYLRTLYLRHHAHAPGEQAALAALIRGAVAEAHHTDMHFALFTCQDGEPVAGCLRGILRTRYRYGLCAGRNAPHGSDALAALGGSRLYDDAVLA